MFKNRYVIFLIVLILLTAASYLYISPRLNKFPSIATIFPPSNPTPAIPPNSKIPKIDRKNVYKIAMIGDSMTAALGPHGGELSEYLNSLYKKNASDSQRIIIDNYATSSSILRVNREITEKVKRSEYTFGPLLSESYDIILVESYAYNPLSQFGIKEGLKKQNTALDELLKNLKKSHPDSVIIFIATISPNIDNYAKTNQTEKTKEEREELAQERIEYLKNHIQYAKSHKIPLINIYERSLTIEGDGNIIYINPSDGIHPSVEGLTFIAHEIGDFIYNNKLLPK